MIYSRAIEAADSHRTQCIQPHQRLGVRNNLGETTVVLIVIIMASHREEQRREAEKASVNQTACAATGTTCSQPPPHLRSDEMPSASTTDLQHVVGQRDPHAESRTFSTDERVGSPRTQITSQPVESSAVAEAQQTEQAGGDPVTRDTEAGSPISTAQDIAPAFPADAQVQRGADSAVHEAERSKNGVFRLLELPSDLRLDILDSIVETGSSLQYLAEMHHGQPLIIAAKGDAHLQSLDLTRSLRQLRTVCRQISEDAGRLFYGTARITLHRAVLRPHDVRLTGFEENLTHVQKLILKDYPHQITTQVPHSIANRTERQKFVIDAKGNTITTPPQAVPIQAAPTATASLFHQHVAASAAGVLTYRSDRHGRKVVARVVRLTDQGRGVWYVEAHLVIEVSGGDGQSHELEVAWDDGQLRAGARVKNSNLTNGLTMQLLYELFFIMEHSPM